MGIYILARVHRRAGHFFVQITTAWLRLIFLLKKILQTFEPFSEWLRLTKQERGKSPLLPR